jgi:hypothetical protein
MPYNEAPIKTQEDGISECFCDAKDVENPEDGEPWKLMEAPRLSYIHILSCF